MAADDQDLTIPAFLRLSPSERPQRMRCLTPMVSLSALAAARERYEGRFGVSVCASSPIPRMPCPTAWRACARRASTM